MTDDIDAVLDPSSSSGPALTGHRHSSSREVSTRLMNSVYTTDAQVAVRGRSLLPEDS